MVDAESTLNDVLATVAKGRDLTDYETKLTLYQSGAANFTSQLYSIVLSAPNEEDIDLFAKVAVIGEKFRTLMPLKVFEVEIKFYKEVVPMYRELEEKHNFPEEVRLVLPKYYGGSTEYMKETLVLEDLISKGYQPFDRFKCFDWEYASRCVTVLARLHALSVAALRQEPTLFAENSHDPAKSIGDQMKDFLAKAAAQALEVTAEEHKEKLKKYLKENLNEKGYLGYFNPKRKMILNHGDLKPCNVLHKRDEDGILEVVLVDFQLIQLSNPLVDLVYFLICGSDEEFRGSYRDRYFDHYYEEFSATLRRLEIDPEEVYTKEDFDGDVATFLRFGLVLGVMALPIITVDVSSAPKLEEGIDIDSLSVEGSNLFGTRLNSLVRDYVKWGYL